MGFRLKVVELGEDSDGDMLTTCIAEEVERDAPGRSGPKLSPSAKTALTILADVILGPHGGDLPARDGFPPGMQGVREEHFYSECETQRLSSADDRKDRDRVRRRAISDLQTKKAIAARDGWWWIVHPAIQ